MHYALRTYDGNCPLLNGLGNELVSIYLCAWNGNKEMAGAYLAGVGGDVEHINIYGTRYLDGLNGL
jgi:hypothetical protein